MKKEKISVHLWLKEALFTFLKIKSPSTEAEGPYFKMQLGNCHRRCLGLKGHHRRDQFSYLELL